jgi:hypothetical protein
MRVAAVLVTTVSALLYVGAWVTFYWRRMRRED